MNILIRMWSIFFLTKTTGVGNGKRKEEIMLASEGIVLLRKAKADDKPCKVFPLLTRKQAVKIMRDGLQYLISKRGDINLKDYAFGCFEKRVNQLINDNK